MTEPAAMAPIHRATAKARPTTIATPPIATDELRITALGIGHGDSILLQWRNEADVWTCLVDGGPSPERLGSRLDELGVRDIDLLVLTHLDTDHVGGLRGIADDRRIGGFLGPALPAFERHLWLFGKRGADAIARGRALEDSLRAAGVEIGYPLEGYTLLPHDGAGEISVLSPPARLVRRLLTADDATDLFVGEPMPLGWLLDTESAVPDANDERYLQLDALLARRFLEPSDVEGFGRGTVGSGEEAREFAQSWSAATSQEPEFFGDSVLNNTSLVLYFELRTEGRAHRLLLPGDQENWTYLLARNPRGLHADVLKASHHGGRVYVESELAYNELFNSVQPRVVLVSGNGRHGLPRAELRQAAVRWGASVVCTCSRGREFFSGDPDHSTCCHDLHACGEARDTVLVLNRDGIRADRQACHSGTGRQPGPIIQIRQHVVDPSPVLGHLAEHELRRHIHWTKKKLQEIHVGRSSAAPDLTPGSEAVSIATLETLARAEGRPLLVPHLAEMLRLGAARGEFWAAPRSTYSAARWDAYALPSKTDVETLAAAIRAKATVLFPRPIPVIGRDPVSLVHELELEGLAEFADATLHYPAATFRDSFWPPLAKAFTAEEWHAFVHFSGSVALSTAGSAPLLFGAMASPRLQKRFGDDRSWDISFDASDFPFDGPILVSGKEERTGRPLEASAQAAVMRTWLTFERGYTPPAYWSYLIGKGVTPHVGWGSRDKDTIYSGALATHVGGNVAELAELLAPSVEMLW